MLQKKKILNPSPDDKFHIFSKMKGKVDDNLEFDENVGKFSKRVENAMGKGETVSYEQFLLFPQSFPQDLYYVKNMCLFG